MLAKYAEKLFDSLVSFIDEEVRYDYTMNIKYGRYRLWTRPFLLNEIVMATDQWEREIKNVLYNEIINSDVIVDVGAYIGDYAIPLAKHVHKVIAFEPNPQTAKVLEKNIELNQIQNIKLFTKAVGEAKSRVKFRLSHKPLLSGIINTSAAPTTLNNTEGNHRDSNVEVEIIDLDTALFTEDRINWLLIDAEGNEINILNGARNIMRKYSPKIIIEIQPENLDAVKKILIEEGPYSITQLNSLVFYARKSH
jgi:FkbM family methyltransferase